MAAPSWRIPLFNLGSSTTLGGKGPEWREPVDHPLRDRLLPVFFACVVTLRFDHDLVYDRPPWVAAIGLATITFYILCVAFPAVGQFTSSWGRGQFDVLFVGLMFFTLPAATFTSLPLVWCGLIGVAAAVAVVAVKGRQSRRHQRDADEDA